MRLEDLPEGREAIVCCLRIDGAMRRRLFDFGLIEGTKIACLRRGVSCVLYRVRGAMIALRRTDAAKICVTPCD